MRDADYVPADLALDRGRDPLFEVIPLEPELRLVVLGAGSVVDGVDIEFPGSPAVKGGFDGNAVADLPAEALCRLRADDGALAVLEEAGPLVIRHDQLGKHLSLRFRIDDELREKILLILIDPAEPVVVRDIAYAGDAQDLVPVGKRNQVDDRGAVDRDQAVGTGQLRVAEERAAHDGEKREQKQRHRERPDGQKQAHLLAKEVGKNQPAKLHATPPAMTFGCACSSLLPSTSTPFSR